VATERAEYEVVAKFTGEGELRRGAAEFDRLAAKAKGSTGAFDRINASVKGYEADWKKYTFAMGAVAGAFVGLTVAAQRGYATLRAGAELQTTTERFGKLAASIGTTADTMLGKLREATKGMISDAELMASASGIVSLRLAENEDQVVRLATVVGTLGWDMQQVILTFANLSTMRLDALGLSVEEVKTKQHELMKQGMAEAAAFKEAVIQAGEARLAVGGVSENEKKLKQLETTLANVKDAWTVAFAEGATSAINTANDSLTTLEGSLMALTPVAQEVGAQISESLLQNALQLQGFGLFADLLAAGRVTGEEWQALGDIVGGTTAEMQAGVQTLAREHQHLALGQAHVTDTAITLEAQLGRVGIEYGTLSDVEAALAMRTEAVTVHVSKQASALYDWSAAVANAVGRAEQIAWGRQAAHGAPGSLSYQYAEQYGGWDGETGREARMGFEEAEEAAYSYGGALSYVNEEEQKAAEAHSAFMAAFNQELRAKPEEGLYSAEGVANVEAVNAALYEQVEAAGASAATLALLGVATGQFTQEQAEAALKAAVLQAQIKAIADEVVAGDLSISDALAQLGQARSALDAANLQALAAPEGGEATIAVGVDADTESLDAAQSQLDTLTSAEYMTTVGMDIQAVVDGATEAKNLIGSIPTNRTMTIRWEQAGADVIAALRALGIIV